MTQRPWISRYADDVEPDLAETHLVHLPAMIRAAATTYSDTTAFTQCMPNGMNGSLTFGEVDALSDDFAAYLREVAGLEQGDRVAVQMPNSLSYPIVAFGVLKAGCVLVNTNPLYTATEMVHQFTDSGAKALIVSDMFVDRLPEALPRTEVGTVVTVRIAEFFPPVIAGVVRMVQKWWNRSLPPITVDHTPFQKALAAGRERRNDAALAGYLDGISADTIAALQYTGGTTGVSKGAMLSHGNLVANTLQMIQMCGANMRPGVEVVLTALPLYHVFAFTVNLLAFFHLGARNILVPSPRPPSNLKRAFENYKITWVTGVNTLFNALLNERWFVDSPPRYLRASAAGGMALHESVAARWSKVTGTPIVEGYGLTETSPVLSFNPFGPNAKAGTIGIPVPSTELRCIDDAGVEVAPGTPGEIAARGPQVMLGYWQRPDDTAASIVDGFFRTGDIAEMDADGFFTIVDRKKDMVLVSGFNVYPNEIEERIGSMPGVLEVGVIGLPDDKTGESVRAYIVATQSPPTEAEVLAHCRETLAAYKVPKSVRFVDELPKSPIGKILRRELRAEAVTSATASIETQGRELS